MSQDMKRVAVPGSASSFWQAERRSRAARERFETALAAHERAKAQEAIFRRLTTETYRAGLTPESAVTRAHDEAKRTTQTREDDSDAARRAWDQASADLTRELRRLGFDPRERRKDRSQAQRRLLSHVALWDGSSQRSRVSQWRTLSATYLELAERPKMLHGIGWENPERRAALLRVVAVNLEAASEALSLLVYEDPTTN